MWRVAEYELFRHGGSVFELWNTALGDAYPITERVFHQHTIGNPYYEAGDGFVVLDKKRVVGFALAKLDRKSVATSSAGAVGVVVVHPAFRRRGIGRSLVESITNRLRGAGVQRVGVASPCVFHFWPGLPVDLEGADAFFSSLGFAWTANVFDMMRDVSTFEVPESVREVIQREQADIGPLTEPEIPDVLEFGQREFPFWTELYHFAIAYGNWDHILAVRKEGRIVGSLIVYGPRSRFRSANLVWESLLGGDVGGFGAVGIAASERSRGLGLALCVAASNALRESGVRNAVVDWTTALTFYGRLGFEPWREYRMGERSLCGG